MTVLTLCIRYCVLISLFALFILGCVHYCIDVKCHHVAVVVELNSRKPNVQCLFLLRNLQSFEVSQHIVEQIIR